MCFLAELCIYLNKSLIEIQIVFYIIIYPITIWHFKLRNKEIKTNLKTNLNSYLPFSAKWQQIICWEGNKRLELNFLENNFFVEKIHWSSELNWLPEIYWKPLKRDQFRAPLTLGTHLCETSFFKPFLYIFIYYPMFLI